MTKTKTNTQNNKMGFFVKEYSYLSGSYSESEIVTELETESMAIKVVFERKIIAANDGCRRYWSIINTDFYDNARGCYIEKV